MFSFLRFNLFLCITYFDWNVFSSTRFFSLKYWFGLKEQRKNSSYIKAQIRRENNPHDSRNKEHFRSLFPHFTFCTFKLYFAARGRGTSSSNVQRDNPGQSVCIFCQQVGHSSNDCPSQSVGSGSARGRQSGKSWFSVVSRYN